MRISDWSSDVCSSDLLLKRKFRDQSNRVLMQLCLVTEVVCVKFCKLAVMVLVMRLCVVRFSSARAVRPYCGSGWLRASFRGFRRRVRGPGAGSWGRWGISDRHRFAAGFPH